MSNPSPSVYRIRLSLSGSSSSSLGIIVSVPINDTLQVKDLYQMFAARLKIPRVVELSYGGYLLNGSDLVKDVIRDNDVIEAVDYAAWAKTRESLCTTSWCRNIQSNWEDDSYPYLDCGVCSNGSDIWFQSGIRKNRKDEGSTIEIFDFSALSQLKDGKTLVLKDNFDGNEFIGEILVEGGNPKSLLLSVKSPTSDRYAIDEVFFKCDRSRCKVSSLNKKKNIQNCYNPRVECKYNIPLPEMNGPKYPEPPAGKMEFDEEEKWEEVGKLASQQKPQKNSIQSMELGRTLIQFIQKRKITCNQEWASHGKIKHTISLDCDVINQDATKWLFTGITSEWMNPQTGQWEKTPRTMVKYYPDSFWGSADESFDIPPKSPIKMIFGLQLECEGKQLDKLSRLHHSFPSPISIRWKLNESSGQTLVLLCSYSNPSEYPPVETKLRRLERSAHDAGKETKVYPWVWNQVDDFDAEGRAWIMGTYQEKSDGSDAYWAFQHSLNSSSSSWFREDSWKKIVWEAGKQNKNEMQIEEWSCNKEDIGHSIEATALIDLINKQVYAVRFHLKTNTGFVKQTYSIHSFAKQHLPYK